MADIVDSMPKLGAGMIPGGIMTLQQAMVDNSENKLMSVTALNGLICGYMLGRYEKDTDLQDFMKGYIKHKARLRGENVVDFAQAKYGKGRL